MQQDDGLMQDISPEEYERKRKVFERLNSELIEEKTGEVTRTLEHIHHKARALPLVLMQGEIVEVKGRGGIGKFRVERIRRSGIFLKGVPKETT